MAIAHPLRLRLILEGLEVPVVSAHITIGMNAAVAAAIQVVPVDAVFDLKPRTMVHLFGIAPNGADLVNFVGELFGVSLVQTPMSRGIVLQCLDQSSYWDTAHAMAIDYGLGGNALTDISYLSGADASQIDNITQHAPQKLVEWLKEKPETPELSELTGLAAGIVRVMEAVGGVVGHKKGINDFFTVAELRCRLLAQVGAQTEDTSSATLLESLVFDEFVTNALQQAGQQLSFRDLLIMLMSYIFHDIVPNPAPYYIPASLGGKRTVPESTKKLVELPEWESIRNTLELAQGELTELGKTWPAVAAVRAVAKAQERLSSVLETVGRLSSANDKFAKAKALLNDARESLRKLSDAVSPTALVDASSFITTAQTIALVFADALVLLADVEEIRVPQSTREAVGSSDRLLTQLFRADCWFAPPPTCNVIFPEMYSQLSYERVAATECTRMLARTHNTIISGSTVAQERDALVSTIILEPTIGPGAILLPKTVGQEGYRALMPHELHTGIIARSDWLSDSLYVPEDGSGQEGANSDVWRHRVVNYRFYRERFANRRASLSGMFNPHLVCGFPALVIRDTAGPSPMQLLGVIVGITHNVSQDGGVTNVTLSHVRRHNSLDDEFLEKAAQLVVDEVTEEVTEATPETVSPEFIAAWSRSSTAERNRLDNTPPDDVIPGLIALSRVYNERLSDVALVTSAFRSGATNTAVGSKHPTSKHISGLAMDLKARPPHDLETVLEAAKLLKDEGLLSLVVDETAPPNPHVHVEISPPTTTAPTKKRIQRPISTKTVPFEELVRPTWMSQIYTNDQIGPKLYRVLLGCGSIMGKSTTVEDAVTALVKTYTTVKTTSQDVGVFIRSLTERPIAELKQVIGTGKFVEDGPSGRPKLAPGSKGTVGFHTGAVQPPFVLVGDLSGLGRPNEAPARMGSNEPPGAIPLEYDVRLEKRAKVQDYLNALGTHAFLGQGHHS